MNSGPHKYPPMGHCIYCGATDTDLSDEHIVPYALNGVLVLPKSSCPACQKLTHKIEEHCTHERYGMFAALRGKLKMKSRTGWGKRKELTTEVIKQDGSKALQRFEMESFPAVAYALTLPPAGIVLGQLPTNEVLADVLFRLNVDKIEGFKPDPGMAVQIGSLNLTAFLQMLAKIGYSFAAAELGSSSELLPLLREYITGKHPNGPYLVGSGNFQSPNTPPATGKSAYRLEMHEVVLAATGERITVVYVQLFEVLGLPQYHIIVRHRPPQE